MSLLQTTENTIWTEKYRPTTLSEYYISTTNLALINSWISSLSNNVRCAKPFLILNGTSGIGKTTLAHLILQHYGYEIIECNASDIRNKKQIRDVLGGISKVSVCIDDNNKFKKTAIIMDEIDGLYCVNEASAVLEIIDIVISKKKKK